MARAPTPPINPTNDAPTLYPWWRWPTRLSLDAPLVAMLWQGLFAHSFNVAWHGYQAFLLGTAVWLVYAADRWLDGYRLDPNAPHSDRHAFYRRHAAFFAVVILLVSLVAVFVLVRYATAAEWWSGAVIATMTLAYMVGVHRYGSRTQRTVPKEVQVGVVFAVGVTLEVWLAAPSVALFAASVGFAILCTLNCGFIAVWESDTDRAQQHPSLVQSHPRLRSSLLPLTVGFVGVSGFGCVTLPQTATLWAMVALSSAGLAGLARAETRLSKAQLRVLGDVVLLTPLLPLVSWWLGG